MQVQPVEQLTDNDLVAEFVRWAKHARLTQSGAAGALGVAQATTSEWWRKIYRDLQPETRRALEDYVSRARGGRVADSNGTRRPDVPELDRDSLRQLYQRYDAIEAADMPEWLRVLRIDALAGLVRGEAMRMAEAATLARAAAIHAAEDAAAERARSAGVEAESAKARTLALHKDEILLPDMPMESYPNPNRVDEKKKGRG